MLLRMRLIFFVGVGVFLALPWACGGKAVIDEGASGAGGATGNTTTNIGTTDTGFTPPSQVVNSSVSVGPPPPLCMLTSGDDDCNTCAFELCQAELGQCCAATGCIDLVACVHDECSGDPDQTTCAGQECPDELSAGAGSIAQAQQLGDCLIQSCGCG